LVVVALVPVALVKVKFCRVDEPRERMFTNVPVPEEVRLPPFAEEKYTLVEVELVVVEFTPVKFWRVVEPVTRRFGTVSRPVEVMAPVKRFVKVPVVAKRLVEVELVVVLFTPVKFCKVEEPRATRLVVVAVLVMVRPPGKM
jgi:hypothetical protein